jgi:hypothetical protein
MNTIKTHLKVIGLSLTLLSTITLSGCEGLEGVLGNLLKGLLNNTGNNTTSSGNSNSEDYFGDTNINQGCGNSIPNDDGTCGSRGWINDNDYID